MLSHHYDRSRAIAVVSQAAGLIAIVALETWLGDAARPWQGLVFALMLACGLGLALRSYYLKQKARRDRERAGRERARKASDTWMSD
jgi:hypothetical protein